MSTAVEWEQEHAKALQEIADALADNDPYLAAELLNRIAPYPQGDNVHTKESGGTYGLQFNHDLEVTDPQTGQLHNQDGPAVVRSDGTRMWYKSGMQHRTDGPAVIKPNGELRYFYLGTKCKNAADLDETVKRASEWANSTRNVRNVRSTPPSSA